MFDIVLMCVLKEMDEMNENSLQSYNLIKTALRPLTVKAQCASQKKKQKPTEKNGVRVKKRISRSTISD